MQPLISVIIPVYNTKDYFEKAIDSLLQQKEYIHEIILVDDGSTDGSGDLLEKLYSEMEIIKIIHKKNEGQGVARNIGTQQATGNFIYYFDSDDIVIDGIFKHFSILLSQNPDLEIFCFSGKSFLDDKFDKDKVRNVNSFMDTSENRKVEALCNSGEEAFNILSSKKTFYVYTWLLIFKKNIIDKNNITFKAIKNEDGEFIHRLFIYAGKTIITNEYFINYRVRAGSTMQIDRSFKDLNGLIQTIKSLKQLLKKDSLKEETKTTLQNQIIRITKDVIIIRSQNKIQLKNDEKSVLRTFFIENILNKPSLLIFTIKYPIEYQLRKLKKQYFS